jgi:hypothetical protein
MTPAPGGEVDELLDARLVVAATHHARQLDRRRDASAAEPGCHLRSRGPRCHTPTPPESRRRANRQGLSSNLGRRSPASKAKPLPGGPRPALTPATPTTRAHPQAPHPPPARPPADPLDTAPLLQECDPAPSPSVLAAALAARTRSGQSAPCWPLRARAIELCRSVLEVRRPRLVWTALAGLFDETVLQ